MSILKKIFGSCGCSCGTVQKSETEDQKINNNFGNGSTLEIKVLGPGCKNCHTLEKNVSEAIKELGVSATISHVTDFAEIAKYGIMSTPGLWVDGKVVSYGKVLSKDEVKTILEKITR